MKNMRRLKYFILYKPCEYRQRRIKNLPKNMTTFTRNKMKGEVSSLSVRQIMVIFELKFNPNPNPNLFGFSPTCTVVFEF